MKKIRLDGSYTVEAAFIVPIIFGIIFSMIYMLFYLHDKAVLYSNIKYVAGKTVEDVRNNGESKYIVDIGKNKIMNKDEEKAYRVLSENLWTLDVQRAKIIKSSSHIKINVTLRGIWNLILTERFHLPLNEFHMKIRYLYCKPENARLTRDLINDFP